MVAKNDVLSAAEKVDQALQRFVHQRGEAKVLVLVNNFGHLHAIVATHGFEGIPEDERIEQVREFLRANVASEDLGYLYRVEALTAAEYDARLLRASQTSDSRDLYIQGVDREDASND